MLRHAALSLVSLLAGVAHADDLPVAPAAPVAPRKPPPIVEARPGQGVTIRTEDGRYSLNLRARVQLRANVDVGAPDDDGERTTKQLWNVNTLRLYFGGNVLSRKLGYLIQLAVAPKDFRDPATPSPVYDAWVEYAVHPALRVRAGQFFVPFDRLRTIREFALQLPDRPRPVGELTLDRDVGVDLSSAGVGGRDGIVGYHAGVFGGAGMNPSLGKTPGALFVGRLELRPLGAIDDDSEGDLERRGRPGLAIGGAVAYNLNATRQRSTTGPAFTGGTVDDLHAAADVVFKWHGAAVEAEYLYRKASTDRLVSTDDAGDTVVERARSGQGAIVQVSYATPINLEVAARFSQMWGLSRAADPDGDVALDGREVAAGLSYYLNGHRAKVQAGWQALFGDRFDHAEHVVNVLVDATF